MSGMPPTRRRLIPGAVARQAPATDIAETDDEQVGRARVRGRRGPVEREPAQSDSEESGQRRPSSNYAATRLVNFRLPVDLHDRYKQLVRDVEERFPRLRHPSLTELIIALLEEGPVEASEVAELIRRKRAAEHGVSP